jgi:hypothetical protein
VLVAFQRHSVRAMESVRDYPVLDGKVRCSGGLANLPCLVVGPASQTCRLEQTEKRVRIPPSPPFSKQLKTKDLSQDRCSVPLFRNS